MLFANKSVLITGSSGFLGKVLLEKLLRSFDLGHGRIYLLIRGATKTDVQNRLISEIMGSEIFDILKAQRNDFEEWFHSRVFAVQGDMTCDGLGLSAEDRSELQSKTNIILHAAASVAFDDPLDQILEKNVDGSERMFDLATECQSLECMIYVSSMSPNCNQPHGAFVEEKIYRHDRFGREFNAPREAAQIREMNADQVATKTQQVLQQWPNTYCYSKFLSEHLLAGRVASTGVPLVICRPSIVGAALREPVPGWIDSKVGLGSGLLALGSGLKPQWHMDPSAIPDVIPVDICANLILLAATQRPALLEHAASDHRARTSAYSGVPVVMIGTSAQNPATWGHAGGVATTAQHYFSIVPISKRCGPSRLWMTQSRALEKAYTALALELPCLLARTLPDMGRPSLRKLKKAIQFRAKACRRVTELLGPFVTNSWTFDNAATHVLLCNPHPALPADVRELAWEGYIRLNCYGMLRYVAKDWGPEQQRAAELSGMGPEALAAAALQEVQVGHREVLVETGRNAPTGVPTGRPLPGGPNSKLKSKQRTGSGPTCVCTWTASCQWPFGPGRKFKLKSRSGSGLVRAGGLLSLVALLLLLLLGVTTGPGRSQAVWQSASAGLTSIMIA